VENSHIVVLTVLRVVSKQNRMLASQFRLFICLEAYTYPTSYLENSKLHQLHNSFNGFRSYIIKYLGLLKTF
jgi:hypothetical protein